MAKQLILLRHAKSSWKDPTLPDIERPLNKRGRRDAPRAGEALVAAGLEPDRVLCSPAVRALETARAVVGSWGGTEDDISVEAGLYHAGTDGILAAVRRQPEDVERLLVIGHNPELEQLVHRLTGRWEILPTAAWALIDLPGASWRSATEAEAGRLTRIWQPREES